jgi:predicted phage tail protein
VSGSLHRLLGHPITWLLVGFVGLFILVFGAAAFSISVFTPNACFFPEAICRMNGWGWTLYAFGVLSLGGGIAGYLVTRREPPSRSG